MREVALVFARLGFTAFGGPAAHGAMMEEEVVGRRKWLDRGHFLDLVASVNFVPGPNSAELAIHLGYIRAGLAGLVVAGVCFITPAVLIILPLAYFYVRNGSLPQVSAAFAGINACVVAIIAAAAIRFGRTAIRSPFLAAVAIGALAIGVAGGRFPHIQPELLALAGAAAAGVISCGRIRVGFPALLPLAAMATMNAAAVATGAVSGAVSGAGSRAVSGAAVGAVPDVASVAAIGAVSGAASGAASTHASPWAWADLARMSLFFLKIGATLFGSGYVLVSYLQSGLVDGFGWLTRRELLDAIAVGQVTPGPLLTTATFIGYVLGADKFNGGVSGGVLGAVAATLAIFLPSFFFIALLGPVLPRLRANRYARGALDAMNAAVVALIAVVCWRLGAASLTPGGSIDWLAIVVAVGSFAAIMRWNVNSTWLILGSALLGVARLL